MNSSTALIKLDSFSYFDVMGSDADKLLQGQITINTSTPSNQLAHLAALCNPKGRIISLFHICCIDAGFRLFMPNSIIETTILNLKKYAVFFKVNIERASDDTHILGVVGMTANDLNSNLQNNQQLSHVLLSGTEQALIVVNEASQLHELPVLLNTEVQNDQSRWYWQLAQEKIPWLDSNTIESFLPHNLNLPQLSAIDFNKGCFTGQEVIARMQYKGKLKQHMQLLTGNSQENLQNGERLEQAGKKMAEVICSINRPNKGMLVLAIVKDSADPQLSLKSISSEEFQLSIHSN